MNRTLMMVMLQYETAEIPLEAICQEHFGMALPQAKRKAADHSLPVPFYRKAAKGGWCCSAADWSDYLDQQSIQAREEWKRINSSERGRTA
jgi:hypothetical protein